MLETAISEIRDKGFCVLKARFGPLAIQRCREAFWPVLLDHLQRNSEQPNRGPHRHFLPMPFDPPCFQQELFFDGEVLSVVRAAMDDRVVADQWGCDVSLKGSSHQHAHVDYQRPLFAEDPDLALPTYMLAVSFGLVEITRANGPIEIAPGTHRMVRNEALRAVAAGNIEMQPVLLAIGDVLIRHPWTLHRGSPNTTETPRVLVTIRYVRRWYADFSRDVNEIPQKVWQSLTAEQRDVMRFPLERC